MAYYVLFIFMALFAFGLSLVVFKLYDPKAGDDRKRRVFLANGLFYAGAALFFMASHAFGWDRFLFGWMARI